MAKKVIEKNRILETGIRLAQQFPAGQLTIQAICNEMGIVKSTFYRQYRSLNDLFSDTLRSAEDETLVKIPEVLLRDESNLEKIADLWDIATREFVKNGPRVLGYILQYAPDIDKTYSSSSYTKHFYMREPFRGTIISLIEKAQATGEIARQIKPETMFYLLHTHFVGFNLNWAMTDGINDYSTAFREDIFHIFGVEP